MPLRTPKPYVRITTVGDLWEVMLVRSQNKQLVPHRPILVSRADPAAAKAAIESYIQTERDKFGK